MKKRVALFLFLFLIYFHNTPYAEQIDGPANVRLSPKGDIVLTLNDGTSVDIIASEGEWFHISFYAVVDKSVLAEGNAIPKNTILRDIQGGEIGKTLNTVRVTSSTKKNDQVLLNLRAYTFKDNIKQKLTRIESPTIVLTPGLSIGEYPLRGKPTGNEEKAVFEPLHGSEEEILGKHQKERDKLSQIAGSHNEVHIGKEVLVVKEFYVNGKVGAKLSRNGKLILNISLGDISPVDPIRGLWSHKNHWVLEVAHCRNRRVEEGRYTVVYTDCDGEIIQDGKSLSKQHDYQETFGFQLMSGKPFYFLKKGGQIGISYDGQEVLLGYSEIPHYECCSYATLNPKVSQNMVSFFAGRGSNWYYVEIGVFY